MDVVSGNRIRLLKNGAEFFPALIAAIDSATIDVRVENYIFEADDSGNRIAAALANAARRGVPVRVLVDGIGSWHTPVIFFETMRQAGVKVLMFRPVRKWFGFRRSQLRRMHRKLALVDGRIGFVGGINLIDDLNGSLSEYPRYDYAVQVEGPLLAQIYPTVHLMWRWAAWRYFRRRDVADKPVPVDPAPVGSHDAAFVIRDSVRNRRSIERTYTFAIAHAKREVLLVCPYFLPGRHLRRVLARAAARGVRITILLQGRADHPMLQLATRALYGQLLAAGISLCEYERSMLHGKVAVVDDNWATVGSSNLDPFSLFLNREANIVVLNADFARQLRESVQAEIAAGAVTCLAEDWQKRSYLARIRSWLAYGLARWAAGMLGFARHWD
ncbi:MAG: cardiolipin synthase ClsB [Betaproteobacteria bacterium]